MKCEHKNKLIDDDIRNCRSYLKVRVWCENEDCDWYEDRELYV